MLRRIFPAQIDHQYRGHWLSLWILGAYSALKLLIGANSLINPVAVATGADGYRVEDFAGSSAEPLIILFSLAGLAPLLMALQAVLVLVRYRSAVALMYVLMLIDVGARRAVSMLHRTDQADGISFGILLNIGFFVVLLVGLVLACHRPRSH